jgi:hypothetical protein
MSNHLAKPCALGESDEGMSGAGGDEPVATEV